MASPSSNIDGIESANFASAVGAVSISTLRKVRRRETANPLVSRKKPQQRSLHDSLRARPCTTSPVPITRGATQTTVKDEEDQSQWMTYKLITTKASLLRGYRHHVMRLQSKNVVNPVSDDEFSRPIRLHRRDPGAPLTGGRDQKIPDGDQESSTLLDMDKEDEQAKRETDRATTLDKIAPYGGAQKQKSNAFKKKTSQVFKGVGDKEKKLRYEEYFPWFLEDFDNRNTWQGQLEQSLSNTFAMFVLDDGAFKMIPIEKWYKFTEKNKYKALDIDQAEEQMKKSTRPPRWLMRVTHQEEKQKKMREEMVNSRASGKMRTRKGDRLEGLLSKSETAEADDLDFEEDRFADDEEAPLIDGPEEENREIEQRIKKEQLSANYFDARDERDYEEEEKKKKDFEAERRKHGKKVQKALMSREGNFTYETDSDENPYKTSSEEQDSDEHTERDEEARDGLVPGKQPEREQSAVPNTVGGNTSPKAKTNLSTGTNSDQKSLKRSGSPELSESGTDKARKKPKKLQASTTVAQIGNRKRKSGEGSGDDTSGETSDGRTNSMQRIKFISRGALSPASRSNSPLPGNSRASSPVNLMAGTTRPQSPVAIASGVFGHITDTEILALLRPEGVTMSTYAGKYGDRLKNPKVKDAFLASIKRLTISRDKKLFRRQSSSLV